MWHRYQNGMQIAKALVTVRNTTIKLRSQKYGNSNQLKTNL